MDDAHEHEMCLDEALISAVQEEWDDRPTHAPDPLDELLVDIIEKELGSEKVERVRSLLHIDSDPSLVLTPGLWLRYPDDPPYIIRVEILKCGKKSSRVFQNGWTKPRVLANRTLIRYRKTVPLTTDNPPKWIKKGAQFRDPYTDMCWEILTVVEGMCSAREKRNGIFSSWTLDELHGHSVRPVRTMWEHLDDDTV